MHTRRRALLILAGLLRVTPPDAAAQAPAATPSSVPAAKPEDVASIDAIINARYASISGPAGHARDWNRLRSPFLPEARMMPGGKRPADEVKSRMRGVGDYAPSGPVIEKNDSKNARSAAASNATAPSPKSSAPTKRTRKKS